MGELDDESVSLLTVGLALVAIGLVVLETVPQSLQYAVLGTGMVFIIAGVYSEVSSHAATE